MEREIINIFKNIYEKQSLLGEINNEELFKNMDISEVHCIDYIGKLEEANGIKISKMMGMTRGGASKLLNKLLDKGYVEKYKKKDNKKEIYFSLTEKGIEIYDKHEIAHRIWKNEELDFLMSISEKEKEVVYSFLRKLDNYLKMKIEEDIK